MRQGQASRTAEYMALFRALENARPVEQRLFSDPLASCFVRGSLRVVVYLARTPAIGGFLPRLIDWRWPGARPSGVARTRLIDDLLTNALRNGLDQVVILGAGFDCRAYRLAGLEHVRVFEVDHPDTLAVKRRRLRQPIGAPPSHVVFAGMDFNVQSLEDVLAASGFTSTQRTFFIWEGVTNYLSNEAVDLTLRFVGRTRPGNHIVFTYVHRGVLDNPADFAGTTKLVETLRRSGESWTFGFEPAELPSYLEARGFELLDDVGSTDYRARYLGSRSRRLLAGYEFYRVALAKVSGDLADGGTSSSLLSPQQS